MAHDIDMAALTDELHQGIGHDTRTNLAAVICFLTASAVKAEIVAVLDDCLVATTTQGHFDTQGSKVIAFLKGSTVHTHTDGNGCRYARRTRDLMDALQQGELVGNRLLQIPFFKKKQVAVSLQLSQQAAKAFRPGRDGIAQLCIQTGNGRFRQVLGQFLIIIDQNDGHHRTGTDIFIPDLIKLRQIHKVQHTQQQAPAVLCTDGRSVNTIPAAVQRHILGTFRLSGSQTFRGKLRQNFLQLLLHHGIGIAGQFTEAVICPDDAAVTQTHQHRRQRAFSFGSRFQCMDGLIRLLQVFL